MTLPRTLGELKNSPWAEPPLRGPHRPRRDPDQPAARLATGEPLFPGIVGYEDTILPQIVNALLARHHFILLGLRGQAKSRILRELTGLLDERIPIVAGSEVNDDPFAPISKYARERLAECGEATPIAWLRRDQRYVEKLATPDVTIADIIGDVDPIKAARGGHLLCATSSPCTSACCPRANRGIFAINELPDLSGKVQVGLFNIMQEGDVQIKGYPVRLPLDVLLAFTANPEDYTARGKIITPLKDRIGSEVITHYPRTVQLGMEITAQEAWTERGGTPLDIPDFVLEVIERVAFEAREDKRVDKRSGVSQRLPISVLENAVSNAERRATLLGEERVVPRVSDVYAAVPSITGKLELEYEGELQGGDTIARELIRRAAGKVVEDRMGGADLGEDRRLVRPGRRAQGPGRRARRALLQGIQRGAGAARRGRRVRPLAPGRPPARRGGLRAGARRPRRAEADQPQRGAGLHPGQAGAAGAGVWEGGDFVRVRKERSGRVDGEWTGSPSLTVPPSLPSPRSLVFSPTPTPAPSPRSPPSPRPARARRVQHHVKVHRVVPVPPVVLAGVPRPHLVGLVSTAAACAGRTPSRAAATWIRKARGATSFTWSASALAREHGRRGPAHQHHPPLRRRPPRTTVSVIRTRSASGRSTTVPAESGGGNTSGVAAASVRASRSTKVGHALLALGHSLRREARPGGHLLDQLVVHHAPARAPRLPAGRPRSRRRRTGGRW